jgi:hypothetical protein
VDGGYAAINDSNPDPSSIKIFYIDSGCRLTRSVSFPTPAVDPEDLALGADGAIWVADTGDNANARTHRASVTVWRLAKGATRPVGYRLSYPDGLPRRRGDAHRRDNLPVIITKELAGRSRLYKPAGQLAADGGTVALASVGRFSASVTGTSNPFGLAGQLSVTGAAMSPDRRRMVVRTYADAYEFDLSGGNVIAALTSGSPRITPLPDEPQGESITYTPDGAAFVTVSDASAATPLLRYQPDDRGAGGASAGGVAGRQNVDHARRLPRRGDGDGGKSGGVRPARSGHRADRLVRPLLLVIALMVGRRRNRGS